MFSETEEKVSPQKEKLHGGWEKFIPGLCERPGLEAGGSAALGSVCKTSTMPPAQSQGHPGACHLVSDITLDHHQTTKLRSAGAGALLWVPALGPSPRPSWAPRGSLELLLFYGMAC